MSWMEWMASKHPLLAYLPVVSALLLPFPLMAAQRLGRGIKPWWVTCRYLAICGMVSSVAALVTGVFLARALEMPLRGRGWLTRSGLGSDPFLMHVVLAGLSLLLGLFCLRSLFRRRQEHEGIGFLGLVLGVLWAAAAVGAACYGFRLAHGGSVPPVKAEASVPSPAVLPSPKAGASDELLRRVLDYLRLEPIHARPVKSLSHGNRWIRVWVDARAKDAYLAGQPLPAGSLAVMSSVEDRWGRPSFDAGPLYALNVKADGKSELIFYWARVPEDRRSETGGRDSVFWRGTEGVLQSCQACHTSGIAPLQSRSRQGFFRRSQAEISGGTSPVVPAP